MPALWWPGAVWLGENLPEAALARTFELARSCDFLLSIGTAGVVQPAALLPGMARQGGARVVQINPMCSLSDPVFDWSLQGKAGVVMPWLQQMAFEVVHFSGPDLVTMLRCRNVPSPSQKSHENLMIF